MGVERLDQECREQRRKVEEREAWRRGVHRGRWMVGRRPGVELRQRRGRGCQRSDLNPRLGGGSGVARRTGVAAAAADDPGWLRAVVLSRHAARMAALGEDRTADAGENAGDNRERRDSGTQISHGIGLHSTALANKK